jgi:hypothetical protein
MPEIFPTYDPETRQIVDVSYFTLTEIAEMLHLHRQTAKNMIEAEDWPRLVIAKKIYVAADDFGRALDGMRRGGIPDDPDDAPRLGIPIPRDPFLTQPADDSGGVR